MKTLKIQNLILVDKTEIHFGPHLNILTGETGSGKSPILSAIRLIAGDRADASSIRNGAEFAIVEAVLEDGTLIRREIYRSGKNRCFIDDAQVNLSTLKQAVNIEMVDQSSSHAVFEEQTEMLDIFGGFADEVKEFKASLKEEKEIHIPDERELEWAQKDLEFIEEIGWQKGEEEKLAEEHTQLIRAQQICEKIQTVAGALNEVSTFKRVLGTLESCARFDKKLEPAAQLMKSALLELEETDNLVQNYAASLEVDPQRLAAVEKRIGMIESLKRRFGPDIQNLAATIEKLTHLHDQVALNKARLAELREKNRAWALRLTEKRQKAAPPFQKQIVDELKSLNIPHAKFEIHVTETVQFFFSANPGIDPVPLQNCASGGELSRLLLAIKTILSHGTTTLIFDEIDSNVGGQTAAILGQKLKKLAENRQVICVTHFVQVAKCALDHFLVSKKMNTSTIIKLSEKEREIEYHRMLGTT